MTRFYLIRNIFFMKLAVFHLMKQSYILASKGDVTPYATRIIDLQTKYFMTFADPSDKIKKY